MPKHFEKLSKLEVIVIDIAIGVLVILVCLVILIK